MREAAVQFSREQELRVSSHFARPQARDLRPGWLVESGIDLDCIEVLGQGLECVEATWFGPGVNNSIPVRVRPSGRSARYRWGKRHSRSPSSNLRLSV